jgi:hypothetical protein
MKLTENFYKKVLKNGGALGGIRVIEGMNMIKVHYLHVRKYYNETPHCVQLTC